jgi:hypothetical protein
MEMLLIVIEGASLLISSKKDSVKSKLMRELYNLVIEDIHDHILIVKNMVEIERLVIHES